LTQNLSLSSVAITLTSNADVNISMNDAQRKINAIIDLPDDAQAPSLNKFSLVIYQS
jgi:HAE1 family hydrophobic/amphiphilic exporter-1